MKEEVRKLKQLVDDSDNIVFFGGAGVSTESGIPDFRSTDGLYHQEWKYPPEVILSHTFYEANPAEFFRFYHAKMLCPAARPNAAHLKLAELEMMKEEIGHSPVLLLDDVMSELDQDRQLHLARYIQENQTILTCTGIEDSIGRLPAGKMFEVQKGKIRV